MRLTLEQIKKAKELDFDYYRCMECNQEQVNIVAGDFPCCWCNNGCNTHGDIFLWGGKRGLPKKVKEELIKQTEESEKQIKQQELIDDALVVYKLSGCRP